jgi:glycogen debranching enzyme
VHEDGGHAELPIATVELQGYWYAARLAMADLLERTGKAEEAAEQRRAARKLRALVEERYWMEDRGFYALALDGKKHVVRSISSNPGHLLWCGLPSMDRAHRVARRLLEGDMYSGYGVRTLSARHRSYNPLSYQLGSVWPHDNALLVAGLMRYGLRDEAARILKGMLDAAALFDEHRLPELFCGFARDDGPPVPYAKANVPQAWAAAAPLLAVQLFLGLSPDVPKGMFYLSPWLPEWLTTLNLGGVVLGNGELTARVRRTESGTRVEEAHHPELEVVEGSPEAPLWGRPLSS